MEGRNPPPPLLPSHHPSPQLTWECDYVGWPCSFRGSSPKLCTVQKQRDKELGSGMRQDGAGSNTLELTKSPPADSEEDAPPKKIKGSPPQLARGGRGGGGRGGAGKAKGKQEVKPKISPGKKEIKSLSDFFGSAPIKRSSELKGKAM